MSKLKGLDWLAFILVIIGAVNWGLFGLWHLDLVAKIFGATSVLGRIIYVLIGLSGVYLALISSKIRKES